MSSIPLGAMRFNSDSEVRVLSGSVWMQIKTFSPNLDGGARGLYSGRSPSLVYVNTVVI